MSGLLSQLQSAWQSLITWVAFTYDNMIHSGFPLIFWVRPKWSIEQIGNQTGKVVLITGANSGTGFASAWALYEAGAKVYLACRSEDKARKAIEYIRSHRWKGRDGKLKGELVFLQMDLSDLKSVHKAAEEFKNKEEKLDILMCNAGIMATNEGLFTKQNYTLQFGTNVIGHQALLHDLLPTLLSTSRSNPSEPPRVLLLSSAGHAMAPKRGIDYQSVVRDPAEKGAADVKNPKKGKFELAKWAEYGQAKWGDIALARYLHAVYGPGARGLQSRRVGEGELLCYSIHPGLVATNLAGHLSFTAFIMKYAPFLVLLITRFPDIGAGNQLWLSTMPTTKARELAGKYVVPFQHVGRPRPDVLVEANVVRLWDWCEGEVKKHA